MIDSVFLDFAGVYDLDGTSRHAFTAVLALVVIYRRVEVLDLDCACRTLLFAHLTADTAVFASKLGRLAVISRRAEHICVFGFGLDAYQQIRTYSRTLTARTAQSGLDLRDTVHYPDSIVLTDCRAVSESDTAEFARAVTAVEALYSLAGLHTVKVELRLCSFTVARAVYHSRHRDDFRSRSTEYAGYLAGGISSAWTA